MPLYLYNSLTQQKEMFKPRKENHVDLYVCGVTVYDYCHVGHARTYTTFDVLIRYLKWLGLSVTYVRNITDIDDKIIKRAEENKETPQELVARFTQIMHNEFKALGLLPPDIEPKATETIPEMIAMINELIHLDYAYAAANGDVYYEVAKFKSYGNLSKQNLDALKAGARVEVDTHKKNPLDFVLWKAAKPGEPSWDSPWGKGRPGWHIECSAMTKKCLGDEFDIHGGGSDLKFPHHENEIAQSMPVNHHFARIWIHSGMVQVNSEKMSKSLGNFFIIHDVLQQYSPEILRYFLMSGHYRSEINYSEDNLNSARAALQRLYTALRHVSLHDYAPGETPFQNYITRFTETMNDDLNTPEALAVLFDLAREINRRKQENDTPSVIGQFAKLLKDLGAVIGILQGNPDQFLEGGDVPPPLARKIEELIARRNEARAKKDFKLADQCRDELKALGIVLEDTAAGTIWRRG